MRKLFISMAVITASICGFYSCNNDDGTVNEIPGQIAELRIETEISAGETSIRSTKSSLKSFSHGTTLSLFVTDGTLGSNYPLVTKNNIKAEYFFGKWNLTPTVKLDERPATIYGFYPYDENYVDANGNINIYVTHQTQKDYIYGTHADGQGTINWNNCNVRLRMKHALSLHQFRIKNVNSEKISKLTHLDFLNNEKSDMASTASIDLTTGRLTNIPGQNQPASVYFENGKILPNREPLEEDYIEILVMPVEKVSSSGSIRICFRIDDTDFVFDVPANTSWKQGTKYVYDVSFNGSELQIDDITIADWIDGGSNIINI